MTRIACPRCGAPIRDAQPVKRYEYRESGLDNLVLLGGGVSRCRCSACEESFVSIHKEQQLLAVIALALLSKTAALAPREIRYLRTFAELTQSEAASLLGLKQRAAFTRYESTGMDRRTELFFRASVVERFWHAAEEGRTGLAKSQKQRLGALRAAFTDLAAHLGREARLTLRFEVEGDVWVAKPGDRKEAA